jgi:hypothetical protein
MVETDGNCNASFDVTAPGSSFPGEVITSTATNEFNDTSEFSRCQPISGSSFYTITPCRVADTRTAAGPYGAPALAANTSRTFVVSGRCGIPPGALAVAFNFTTTQPAAQGDLRIVPGGVEVPPLVSTLNYRMGQTRGNNATLALGPSGEIVVYVDQPTGTVDFIIDVFGFFE